jgi:hypothetical protein
MVRSGAQDAFGLIASSQQPAGRTSGGPVIASRSGLRMRRAGGGCASIVGRFTPPALLSNIKKWLKVRISLRSSPLGPRLRFWPLLLVSSLTIRNSKLRTFVSFRSVFLNPFFDRRTNPRQHCKAAALGFRSRDFRQFVVRRRVAAVTTLRFSIF